MLSLNRIDEESKLIAYNSNRKIYYSPDDSLQNLISNLNLGIADGAIDAMKSISIDINKGDELIPSMQHHPETQFSNERADHLVIGSAGSGKSWFVKKLIEQYKDICKKKKISTKIYLFTFAEKEIEPLYQEYYKKSDEIKKILEEKPDKKLPEEEIFIFKYIPLHKLTQTVSSNDPMFKDSLFIFDDAFSLDS